MKTVSMKSSIDHETCIGCGICAKVCPTLAIIMDGKTPRMDESLCRACANCQQRCPTGSVSMVRLEKAYKVSVEIREQDRAKIEEYCIKAGFNPSQILCYCTATRAEEVAAAIIQGAHTPEAISLATGLRTGCSVECIQPALRLLEAAGITPTPPEGGWQWYGKTVTLKEIPQAVKDKYANRGFCFEEDLVLFDTIAHSPRR